MDGRGARIRRTAVTLAGAFTGIVLLMCLGVYVAYKLGHELPPPGGPDCTALDPSPSAGEPTLVAGDDRLVVVESGWYTLDTDDDRTQTGWGVAVKNNTKAAAVGVPVTAAFTGPDGEPYSTAGGADGTGTTATPVIPVIPPGATVGVGGFTPVLDTGPEHVSFELGRVGEWLPYDGGQPVPRVGADHATTAYFPDRDVHLVYLDLRTDACEPLGAVSVSLLLRDSGGDVFGGTPPVPVRSGDLPEGASAVDDVPWPSASAVPSVSREAWTPAVCECLAGGEEFSFVSDIEAFGYAVPPAEGDED